jgi:hypothetical protein
MVEENKGGMRTIAFPAEARLPLHLASHDCLKGLTIAQRPCSVDLATGNDRTFSEGDEKSNDARRQNANAFRWRASCIVAVRRANHQGNLAHTHQC